MVETADYARLLGPEIHAFVAETEAAYPADAVNASVSEQRAFYDALCAKFDRPHPPGLVVENLTAGAAPLRRYTPANPQGLVLYLHGGGFVVGGLDSHDAICAEIADQARACVVAVDYRLAPEHRHPAALEDAQAALDWLLAEMSGQVVLCGDSAGGTLAASLAHTNRRNPRLAGQALVYPWLGEIRDSASMIAHANAPMLTRADMQYYEQIIRDPDGAEGLERLLVLSDPDKQGLPPSFVVTAECDPLASDGHDYAAALQAAGGPVALYRGEGLVHGFLRARHTVPAAARAFAALTAAIGAMLA